MKFDVIIGNPPYQEMTGGGGVIEHARPVYHDFMQRSIDFGPRYLVMIIPARWYSDDSTKSINLRHRLFRHMDKLIDFPNSRDCFKDVLIAGGICCFMWDIKHDGETDVYRYLLNKASHSKRDFRSCEPYIRYDMLEKIAEKVRNQTELFVSDYCLDSNPFGFETYKRGRDAEQDRDIMILSSSGVGYINVADVEKNQHNVYRYKVITGYKTPGSDNTSLGVAKKVINMPQILIPGMVCTQTYFVVGAFDTPDEAENFKEYLETRFARAMILVSVVGTTLTRKTYGNLPFLDFTRKWTDVDLNKLYGLEVPEILFIEDLIKEMK